ncbi:hypothetical protein [Actinomadura opuntiae]|uniref:hypothetical protein n=1 Tax=Actinomadura sp. OS1-43 TaxID=604315 RepID=UPI00255A87E1|nr:hypothetical protein [Actinomadura sp. OS1-43]MDL4817352.1 hypothetical protein [Actinomadura sp. OS1-43]
MDPVLLMGTPFLTAAFEFLFRRGEKLIDRRGPQDDELTLDPGDLTAIKGQLRPLRVDEAELIAVRPDLERIVGALSSFQRNPSRIDSEGEQLQYLLGELRESLEWIYGQRITFEGEQREASGALVRGRFGTVAGEVTGISAKRVRGNPRVDYDVEEVTRDGKVTGIRTEDLR